MNNKECVRTHFKKLGYKPSYNKKIKDSITYAFDLFKKEEESIAVYVLGQDDSFSSLIDVAQMISLFEPSLKIVLCIPSDLSVSVEAQFKALNCNVDLYIIKDRYLNALQQSINYKLAEKYSLSEIEKTLMNINRICKFKYGFSLFKIKRDILKKLFSCAKNEKDFIFQITTISSIIESINFKDIKTVLPGVYMNNKEAFDKEQSIKVIEGILNEKFKCYNPSTINTMRELRDLRNIPPVHSSSSNFEIICKRYIGKRKPTKDSEWLELSQIAFTKFKGSLILLRNILK